MNRFMAAYLGFGSLRVMLAWSLFYGLFPLDAFVPVVLTVFLIDHFDGIFFHRGFGKPRGWGLTYREYRMVDHMFDLAMVAPLVLVLPKVFPELTPFRGVWLFGIPIVLYASARLVDLEVAKPPNEVIFFASIGALVGISIIAASVLAAVFSPFANVKLHGHDFKYIQSPADKIFAASFSSLFWLALLSKTLGGG